LRRHGRQRAKRSCCASLYKVTVEVREEGAAGRESESETTTNARENRRGQRRIKQDEERLEEEELDEVERRVVWCGV